MTHMGALYFKDFKMFALPNIYYEKNFSGSCLTCWNVTQGKAKQSKAWPKVLVYKGISVYFSLKTCKGDIPHLFTPLPFPSRKLCLFWRSWCFAFVYACFSWRAVPWRFKWRTIFYTLKNNNFIYLFMTVLGLRGYMGFSLVAASEHYSQVVVCRLLTAVASLVLEQGL